MSMSWGNWEVRVFAAQAWVSLAPRFAAERPEIVDRIGEILTDHRPAVRLQAAQNLQVICKVAPERMWEMGAKIAAAEADARVLTAYLDRSLRRFTHTEPERCEHVLAIAKERLADFDDDVEGRDHIQRCLGGWVAQLQVGQGRSRTGAWLDEWVADPSRFRHALNAYLSSLRGAFFRRYANDAGQGDTEMNDRAQEGLASILRPALEISAITRAVLASEAPEEDKLVAGGKYRAVEFVIHHAMNQLYFGAGTRSDGSETGSGLNEAVTKARFLADYADILALLRRSREPATQHHLIELYEHLVDGDPIAVFAAIHEILLGPGAEEGYQFESLGSTTVVKVVRRYVADYRGIFDDPERRANLVQILQLFSEVGWTDALKLLYELPDLLR